MIQSTTDDVRRFLGTKKRIVQVRIGNLKYNIIGGVADGETLVLLAECAEPEKIQKTKILDG